MLGEESIAFLFQIYGEVCGWPYKFFFGLACERDSAMDEVDLGALSALIRALSAGRFFVYRLMKRGVVYFVHWSVYVDGAMGVLGVQVVETW